MSCQILRGSTVQTLVSNKSDAVFNSLLNGKNLDEIEEELDEYSEEEYDSELDEEEIMGN